MVLFEFGHVQINLPKERLVELSLRRTGDAGQSRPPGCLADALWAARRASGFARATVAGKIGVSMNTVYRWETGVNSPSAPALQCLARLYEVPYESFQAYLE